MSSSVLHADAIPLIPDGDEARRWAEAELADPGYAAAEPTPIDRVARAIGDWVGGLLSGAAPAGWGPGLAVVVVVVLVAVVLVALLVWGRPRTPARARRDAGGDLFGADGGRTAAQLRAEAESRAAEGAWPDAIAARFRALARSLEERGVVETPPGATVHAFARAAGIRFPSAAETLEDAARTFDDVRYLRRPGTAEGYAAVRALDERLAAQRPATPAGAA